MTHDLPSDPWGLTPRQREIVSLLFTLDLDKVIAHRLGTSHRTVEYQLAGALKRMKVTSRVQAAVLWDRWVREQLKEAA